jgi:hypothetical protein
MSNFFISYSRRDLGIAEKIITVLRKNALEPWLDWKSIPKGEDWEEEIYRGIEGADIFLFLVSPDSIASEWCKKEIDHAVKNNKRILPIVVRDSDPKSIHPEISKRNWIFCRDGQDDFGKAIEEVRATIGTDYDWLKFHTQLQLQALLWERNKDSSRLLRGKELVEAEQQLAKTETFRDPQPTNLQRIYILESQRYNAKIRQRTIIVPLALNLVVILSMGIYILYLSRQLAQLRTTLPISVSQTEQFSTLTLQPTLTPPPTVQSTAIPIVTETTQQISPPNVLEEIIKENRNKVIVSIVVTFFGFLLAFLVFFLSASRFGTTVFSRSWLRNSASKFSQAFPGLFKRVIFIGYKNRLLAYREIDAVRSNEYFGLPAIDSFGNNILPDKNGHNLDDAIVKALEPRKPVIVIGNGGAGKSTLLARWVFLSLNNQLSPLLKGFRPILITPPYYDGNLLEAITVVLRERDRVGVNTSDVHAQLESGKFLILFDGISEMEGDQAKGLQDILRIARNAEYENCRFLLTSRPGFIIQPDIPVFRLQPLTPKIIKGILPRYQLGKEREYQISQQLDRLEMKTIEPLMFSMILAQSEGIFYSNTRSQLYERYFRRLLKLDSDTSTWNGWKAALEILAKWFTLETGRRGVGIPHEKLVSQIEEIKLPHRLEKNYHLIVKDGWELLMRLNSAGLLTEGRRWRFKHDTFEEYFAANYLISQLVSKEDFPNISWDEVFPEISSWVESDDQQRSFLNILRFIREIAEDKNEEDGKGIENILIKADLPLLWKNALQQKMTEAE